MKETVINIENIPFSSYGSKLAVTKVPGKNELMIHSTLKHFGQDNAIRIAFVNGFQDLKSCDPKGTIPCEPFTVTASPVRVDVTTKTGHADICMIGKTRISIHTVNQPLEMFIQTDYGFGKARDSHRYGCPQFSENRYTVIESDKGTITADGPYRKSANDGDEYRYNEGYNLMIMPEDGEILLEVQIDKDEARTDPVITREEAMAQTGKDWEKFLATMPEVPAAHEDFARVTWFNQWSAFIHGDEKFGCDVMLMSKKSMSCLWTWDHCFNALCIAEGNLDKALDQFYAPFELQNPSGVLFDMTVPELETVWGVTKPPIHGWCIGKLMEKYEIDREFLEKAYNGICRLNEWWFNYRDEDGDGIPEYPQGCDSGWDNATYFTTVGHFMETPDLPAFLILQMKTLSKMAYKLGRNDEAENWSARADETMKKFIAHCWNGEKFVAKQNGTHIQPDETGCLLAYMPLILGEYLPKDIADRTAEALVRNNLTEYGLASEAPASRFYEPDGYWRGPIWAPSTYLIVDGLRRMGKREMAFDIARRFCKLCAFDAKGNYENFDALTGRGLRAPGYTWTGSVYMCLLQDFKDEFDALEK